MIKKLLILLTFFTIPTLSFSHSRYYWLKSASIQHMGLDKRQIEGEDLKNSRVIINFEEYAFNVKIGGFNDCLIAYYIEKIPDESGIQYKYKCVNRRNGDTCTVTSFKEKSDRGLKVLVFTYTHTEAIVVLTEQYHQIEE